jgi:hypothetical protein
MSKNTLATERVQWFVAESELISGTICRVGSGGKGRSGEYGLTTNSREGSEA